MADAAPLVAMRAALDALASAERDRASAWALSASGLLEPAQQRAAQIAVEQRIEEARERVRRAREALPTAIEERAWGGH